MTTHRQNEIYGTWSHTNTSATGAEGTWIFEFKRSLATSDTLKQDVQFEIGKTYKMVVAYWDADELGEPGVNYGWTAAGHYSTCTDPSTLGFSWIDIELIRPEISQGPPEPAGAADWTNYVSVGSLLLAVVAIAIAFSKRS